MHKKQNKIQNIKPFLTLNRNPKSKKKVYNNPKKDLKPFTKKIWKTIKRKYFYSLITYSYYSYYSLECDYYAAKIWKNVYKV